MATEKRFKVGDKVLWVHKYRDYNFDTRKQEPKVETKEREVLAVGRKWVTTDGGGWRANKFDIDTGKGDGNTSGTIYKDAEEYQRFEEAEAIRCQTAKDWRAFRNYASRLYETPNRVVYTDIRAIGTQLGMKEEDWNRV